MKKNQGFTLTEMLVSMAIFAVVAFLTMNVVTQALQYNARQQATVAAQSKLRRVVEVIGQEVRGSVFGGIANAPYVSNDKRLSIYLFEQGSGYTVANEASFETLSYFKILTSQTPNLKEIILIDSEKTNTKDESATIFPITSVASAGTDVWRLNHPSCTNGIAHNRFLLAFGVNSIGFRLDEATDTLMLSEGGVEAPMAFGITEFKVDYVYSKQSGGTLKRSTPFFIDNDPQQPAKIYEQASPAETFILSELQITISTEEIGKGKVTRSYTGQVPLLISSNDDFKSTNNSLSPTKENAFRFTGVRPCN